MIEAYAFLAVFALQIFVGSVVNPARLIRYVRGWTTGFASERYAQLHAGFDYKQWAEGFVVRYRAANIFIALLGVLVLGWLFTLLGREDWVNEVTRLTVGYFFLQFSPLFFMILYTLVRYRGMLKQLLSPSTEPKRTATLQRRGLFDFVSPFAVFLAGFSYLLSVALALYVDSFVYHNPSPSMQCYIAIGTVTLVYAMNAFVVYKSMYGKKNLLVKHEGRVHSMGLRVRSLVYTSVAVAWFMSLMCVIGQPDLRTWAPFSLSAFFVIVAFISFKEVALPPRKPEALIATVDPR